LRLYFSSGAKTFEDAAASSLCITLKDHNNVSLKAAMATSQSRTIKKHASSQGYELDSVLLKDRAEFSTKQLTVWLTARASPDLRREIVTGLRTIQHLLDYHLVDQSGEGNSIFFNGYRYLSIARLIKN